MALPSYIYSRLASAVDVGRLYSKEAMPDCLCSGSSRQIMDGFIDALDLVLRDDLPPKSEADASTHIWDTIGHVSTRSARLLKFCSSGLGSCDWRQARE